MTTYFPPAVLHASSVKLLWGGELRAFWPYKWETHFFFPEEKEILILCINSVAFLGVRVQICTWDYLVLASHSTSPTPSTSGTSRCPSEMQRASCWCWGFYRNPAMASCQLSRPFGTFCLQTQKTTMDLIWWVKYPLSWQHFSFSPLPLPSAKRDREGADPASENEVQLWLKDPVFLVFLRSLKSSSNTNQQFCKFSRE